MWSNVHEGHDKQDQGLLDHYGELLRPATPPFFSAPLVPAVYDRYMIVLLRNVEKSMPLHSRALSLSSLYALWGCLSLDYPHVSYIIFHDFSSWS